MDAYQNIEQFLAGIPADFDAWNSSDKLDYYGNRVYGFRDFTDTQQFRIVDQYSTDWMETLLQYYKVPKFLGFVSENSLDVKNTKVFLDFGVGNLTELLDLMGVFDNGTIFTPECKDFQQEFNQFLTFLLVPTFVFALFVSLMKTRKNLFLNVLQGRPGVQYPLNLIDESGKAWAHSSVFIIMVYCVFWMFDMDIYNDPDNYMQHADQWGWKFVVVLMKLLKVTHAAIICYPLFESITLRRHLLMNVVGISYIIAWIYYMSRKYFECNPFVQYVDYDAEPFLYLMQDLPQLLAVFLLLVSFTGDLVQNIRKLTPVEDSEKIDSNAEFLQLKPIAYLRGRLKKKTFQSNELSTRKEKIQNSLSCVKIEGLGHSPRVFCTVIVSAVVMARFLIEADSTGRHYRSEFFHYIKLFKPMIDVAFDDPNMYENVIETFETGFWSFYSSLWSSFLLHLFFGVHMIFTYRKHTRLMIQGKYKWRKGLKDGPVSTVTAGMRYSGYQIMYLLFGFLLLLVGQSIGSMLVAHLVVLPLKHWKINFVLEYFVDLIPVIFVGVVIFFGQLILVKRFFAQQKGTVLALDNRRMYHVLSYFLYLPNILVGLGSALKRFFVHLSMQFVLVSRMDRPMSEGLDAGHRMYVAMLRLEVSHNHPLLKAFVLLLTREVDSGRLESSIHSKGVPDEQVEKTFSGVMHRKMLGTHELHLRTSRRARLRWHKAYTLVRNPSLLRDVKNPSQEHKVLNKEEHTGFGISIGESYEVGSVNAAFEIPSVSVSISEDDRFTAL